VEFDKKSLFPQKENIDLTMEITPSDIGDATTPTTPIDPIIWTMNGDITYTDYNIPVTIELPSSNSKCRRNTSNRNQYKISSLLFMSLGIHKIFPGLMLLPDTTLTLYASVICINWTLFQDKKG